MKARNVAAMCGNKSCMKNTSVQSLPQYYDDGWLKVDCPYCGAKTRIIYCGDESYAEG